MRHSRGCCSDPEAHFLLRALRERGVGGAFFASLACAPKETLRQYAAMSDTDLVATVALFERDRVLSSRLSSLAG